MNYNQEKEDILRYIIGYIHQQLSIQDQIPCEGGNETNINRISLSETTECTVSTQSTINIAIQKTNEKLLTLVKGYIRESAMDYQQLSIPECLNYLFHAYHTILSNSKDLLDNMHNISHQQEILTNISTDLLNNVQQLDLYHDILKQLLLIQIDQTDNNYLYWTGLLLYIIGDINDIDILWKAKESDLDRFSHFDVQYLTGYGIENTIKYCDDNDLSIISDYLRKCKISGDLKENFDPMHLLRSHVDCKTQH